MAKSIISESKRCYICGKKDNLHLHHIFGGTANRKKSDEDKLTVWLCASCHNAIHTSVKEFDRWLAKALKQLGQQRYKEYYKKTDEDFIKRYGKSYL